MKLLKSNVWLAKMSKTADCRNGPKMKTYGYLKSFFTKNYFPGITKKAPEYKSKSSWLGAEIFFLPTSIFIFLENDSQPKNVDYTKS